MMHRIDGNYILVHSDFAVLLVNVRKCQEITGTHWWMIVICIGSRFQLFCFRKINLILNLYLLTFDPIKLYDFIINLSLLSLFWIFTRKIKRTILSWSILLSQRVFVNETKSIQFTINRMAEKKSLSLPHI